MTDIVYAQSDADIVMIHRFLCVVARPQMIAVHNPHKSMLEVARVVQDPGYGCAIMAVHEGFLVGTLGLIHVNWWYADSQFLTDRFYFVVEPMRNKDIGAMLEDEAIAVAQAMQVPLVLNGKTRRKANGSFQTTPRVDVA